MPRPILTRLATFKNGDLLLCLGAIMVLAALLRLLFLSQDSFWHDEILSVERALMDGEDFWDLIQGFPNMAFYYWVLRYWIVLGESEVVVRMLSVVAALAAVLGVYFLGARLFGPRVGVISALLLAINAFHIQYSQEARSYSLVILLVTLASLFLVRSVQRPSWSNWMVYAVLMALSVYTHYFGALVLAAHGMSLMFLPRRVIPWKRLMVSASVIAVALLMPVSFFASLAFAESGEGGGPEWVPDVSLNTVYGFTLRLTGNSEQINTFDVIYLAYFIPVVAAGVISLRKWYITKASLESWKFALLWAWLVVPVLITLAVSFLVTNAFVTRYLIIVLPPLVVLAAVGISEASQPFKLRVPLVSAAILMVLVAISARGVYAYYTDFEKEDWRGISTLIASQWRPGDGMLFYVPWMEGDVGHYLEGREETTAEMDSMVSQRSWKTFVSSWELPDQDAIADYLPDDRQRVWLVLSHNRTPEHRRILTNEIREALSSKYRSVNSTKYYRISVDLYSDPVPGVFGGQWKDQKFPVDQPWEAEDGEVVAPLQIVNDSSASSGKHILQLDKSGKGYARYYIVIPRDGVYQIKGNVKSEEGPSSSAKVSFDGGPPNLWRLEESPSDWTWVFGPTIHLPAGVHELKIFLGGPTFPIDKLELKSR